MKRTILLGIVLLLGLQLVSAYHPVVPGYAYVEHAPITPNAGVRVQQQHVYDVQNIPRYFTHYRQNVLQTAGIAPQSSLDSRHFMRLSDCQPGRRQLTKPQPTSGGLTAGETSFR